MQKNLVRPQFATGFQKAPFGRRTISGSGYTVDDHLIKALTHFLVPVNRTDIRSFYGLVQQFQSFSPRLQLTELLAPIGALLSPKSEFTWEAPHQEAFEQVIRELASPRALADFMPSRPLRLETDAAQSKGLGMALWQQQPSGDWRLLQCGSRHVTAAESRYSATEVELLAVVWATPKAHLYLAGSDFELLVDHRPLIPLLNSKAFDEMPSPRPTRLKEKLTLYRLTAVWRPGVEHKVVDCFSRHPVDDPSPDNSQEDDEVAAYIRAMLLGAHTEGATGDHILPLLDPHLTRLRTEANSDDKYKRLRTTVQQGFPTNKRQLDAATAATAPLYGLRKDLWATDDLVMYGSRVIIPASLRCEVLHGLHASHQGQDRTLRRARQVRLAVLSSIWELSVRPSQTLLPLERRIKTGIYKRWLSCSSAAKQYGALCKNTLLSMGHAHGKGCLVKDDDQTIITFFSELNPSYTTAFPSSNLFSRSQHTSLHFLIFST